MRYRQFNKLFDALPATVRRDARAAYKQFVADSSHPRLHLETMHGKRSHLYYSVRVGLQTARPPVFLREARLACIVQHLI
jgi:hypothetical protein